MLEEMLPIPELQIRCIFFKNEFTTCSVLQFISCFVLQNKYGSTCIEKYTLAPWLRSKFLMILYSLIKSAGSAPVFEFLCSGRVQAIFSDWTPQAFESLEFFGSCSESEASVSSIQNYNFNLFFSHQPKIARNVHHSSIRILYPIGITGVYAS